MHHPLSQSYTSTGSIKVKAVDVSILVKGPGKGVVYHDIDRSIVSRTSQRTHELEGSWCANTPLGIIRINIGPIVNYEIEGNGESFTKAYRVTGRFEPSVSPTMGSTEKLEKPTGYLDVYLKCERQPTEANVRPLIFKGRYDPSKELFRGQWEVESKPEDTGIPEVSYSRISPCGSRFTYLLRPNESRVDPFWTLARRRWAFAIEAVLSQVQVQMGSSKVMKRGTEQRRKWLQVSVFEGGGLLIQDNKNEDQCFIVDQQLFETLESSVPAENGRVYQALAEYLHLRKVYDL